MGRLLSSGGVLYLMVLVAAAVATGCAGATPTPAPTPTPVVVEKQVVATPTPRPKEKIVFADGNWDSIQIQARVAMHVVEHGFGYPVDKIFGGTVPLFTGLREGDIDVTMEIWLPNQQAAWDKAVKAGQVQSAGKSLPDNWQSAFIVPTYVVEENPGLKTAEDIPEFKELFVTPQSTPKARYVTCVATWECNKINAAKIEGYGLDEVLKPIVPGSASALFADLRGAYQKKEPWLGYMWGPTTIAVELDLTRLQEEPFSQSCWDGDKTCAYPTSEVFIGVNTSLPPRAPGVMEFLNRWGFSADEFIATKSWMSENEASVDEAAAWYMENHKDTWTGWLPEQVAEKAVAALP